MATTEALVVYRSNWYQNKKFSFILPFIETRFESLFACIQSIRRQQLNNFELILVYQSPHSNFPSLEEYLYDISSLYIHTNQTGISIARNIGAFYSRGEYLLFAEDDAVYPTGFLLQLDSLELAQKNIYHCMYVDPITNESSVCRQLKQSLSSTDFSLRYASSLCIITRRSDFISLDGFDMRLGLGPSSLCLASEDTEYLCRAIFFGFKFNYVPDLVIKHPINHRMHRSDFQSRLQGSGAAECYIRLSYIGLLSALIFLLYTVSSMLFAIIRFKPAYCNTHFNRLFGFIMIFPRLLSSCRLGFSYVKPYLHE